jgi:aerobic-type carbon monoxide dehydrogenase small subunit (CoxS/CutS family)
VRLLVNGEEREVTARSDEMLLEVLRREGFASVREACGVGVCGTCTVLLDGAPVSGCLTLAKAVEGVPITTVEGLGADDPVTRAFAAARAFQCGYCTPGMILTTKALLAEAPSPSESEIRQALAGNLCRCGCYVKIVDAVRLAASGEGRPNG